MTGVEVDAVQRPLAAEVDAAGAHESHGRLDVVGDRFVSPSLDRRGDELLVPRVDAREVGEPTLRERAQQVEGRRALVVRGEQSRGVGRAVVLGEGLVVDDVSPKALEGDAVAGLGLTRAGLGKLPGDATDLDDRHTRRVGEDDGHLEDHAQLVPDGVGGAGVEGLRAVAGLEEKGATRGDVGQFGLQVLRFAGEDEGRLAAQLLLSADQSGGVGPAWGLRGRAAEPRLGGPLESVGHR